MLLGSEGGRVVACTLEKSGAGGGVDVKAAVVDLLPSSCTRKRVRLRNPARTPNTVSCQVARPPLRSSHARHTPYSLRLSHPFPLAPHLIASFCRLSCRRRHPNCFSLPHCVTIRGTELISTLPVVPPKRPHDSHLQYYSFTTPSRKEIKLGISFTSYSFLPVGDTK